MFTFDESRYRLVDLSAVIAAPGTEDRPLRAKRGYLADRAYKHDVETHTHVGAHVESPAHFFDDGKALEDYPLSRFHGRGVLFDFRGVDGEAVDGAALEAGVGDTLREGDILLFHNTHPDWRRVENEDRDRLPWLSADGCRWLAARRPKMIVIDFNTGVRVANGPESSRENHAILMAPETDILLLEGADGLDNLNRREFYFMALPLNFHGLDSVWARAVAVEER